MKNQVNNDITNSVMADHVIAGLEISEGRASISKNDLACLLMFLNNTRRIANSYNSYNTIPIEILNRKLWFSVTQTIYVNKDDLKEEHNKKDAGGKRKLNFEYTKISDYSDIPDGWLASVEHAFSIKNYSNSKKTTTEVTPTIEITVYGDEMRRKFHTKFTVYASKGKNKFFINANCAPTQLLTGNNSLPIEINYNKKDFGKSLVSLFIVPFIFLNQILNDHVFNSGMTSNLSQDVENYNVILPKTQYAGYSVPFKNHRRTYFMELLFQVYNSSIIRRDTSKSIDIPSILSYKIEKDSTTISSNKNGVITNRSGFLMRFTKSNGAPTFSIGFYAKDIVNGHKRMKDKIARGDFGKDFIPQDDRTAEEIEIDDLVNNSIRFDLSIHKHGYYKLSSYLNSKYPNAGIDVIPENDEIYAFTIIKFLNQVYKIDNTLSVFFKYVFLECMRMDQLFFTTEKQWQKAFDYLKSNGMSDLVAKLEKRQNTHKGESFSQLIRKTYKNKNSGRLRGEIAQITKVKKEGKLVNCGIDISFPYMAQLQARLSSIDIYDNPKMLDYLYRTGNMHNEHNPKKIGKEAERLRKHLYISLVGNKLRQMPVQNIKSRSRS